MALPEWIRGAMYGVAAAGLFGLSAPLAKMLMQESNPVAIASLLYLGAAAVLSIVKLMRPATVSTEARLRRSDIPLLIGVIVTGGVMGPLLMLFGLARTSAVTGSLLLNLEAPFTIFVAVGVLGEHLGRREMRAALLIVLAGAMLGWKLEEVSGELFGAIAIAGACGSWAIDNNLTQRLSLRDPVSVAVLKALAAGLFNLLLALGLGVRFPPMLVVLATLATGAVSYGMSIVLDTYALRILGAAREAAYFATAPFFGAISAALLFDERLGGVEILALGAMVIGIVLLLRERHGHVHDHETLVHDHLHTHDEHHRHHHEKSVPTTTPHAHPHAHAPLRHAHAHVSDIHHRHLHGWPDE